MVWSSNLNNIITENIFADKVVYGNSTKLIGNSSKNILN